MCERERERIIMTRRIPSSFLSRRKIFQSFSRVSHALNGPRSGFRPCIYRPPKVIGRLLFSMITAERRSFDRRERIKRGLPRVTARRGKDRRARFKRNLLRRYHRNKPGERPNELSGIVRSNFLYRKIGKRDSIASFPQRGGSLIIISLLMRTQKIASTDFSDPVLRTIS